MQAGRAQAQRREQPVELIERAAAHQGERAPGRRLQLLEDATQTLRHVHRAGLALDLEQSAVDIQKERDVRGAQHAAARGRLTSRVGSTHEVFT